jgi:hypothetical protein
VLDPDGPAPDESEHLAHRGVSITAKPDGGGTIHGDLTPACLAVLQAALDPLAAPRPRTEHERDTRTGPQRLHDALEDLGLRILGSGGLPDSGGTHTTLLITMTIGEFETRSGYGVTGHGGTLALPEALRLAADADVIPVIFTDTGGILSYGRGRRTASPGQRRALAARDRGCSFPGCDRPPNWCQTHHQPDYHHGGTTDIAQMTLLCGYHHREHQRSGWHCRITDGVPYWVPPRWIDPHQHPIKNTANG